MRVLLIIFSLLVCSARANYDDPVYSDDPIYSACHYRRGGFYLGARAGGEALNTRLKHSVLTIKDTETNGTFYGGYLGYQLPISNMVSISLEGEYSRHNTALKLVTVGFPTRHLEFEESFGGNVRMSFELYEYIDFYIYAGITRLRVNATTTTTAPPKDGKTSDDVTGKMGGVGLELMNSTPMRMRLEYRFTQYGEFKLFRINNIKEEGNNDPQSNTFTLGVQYNF